MPKDLVFEGLRIDYQMTFEKLLSQLSQESTKRISKWWWSLPGDHRELINQLIDLAYVTGEESAKIEAFNLLAEWTGLWERYTKIRALAAPVESETEEKGD